MRILDIDTHRRLESLLRRGERLRVWLDARDVTDHCTEAREGDPDGSAKLVARDAGGQWRFDPVEARPVFEWLVGRVRFMVRTRGGWSVPYRPPAGVYS